MARREKKPNKKECAFIEEYVRCWKGAPAARAAGISVKNARQWAYEALTKPYIQKAIEKRLEAIRMSTNEIYARLSEQARGDITNFIELYDIPVLDKEGNHLGDRQSVRIKPDAFEKVGHLIKSITPTSNGDFKVELYSSQTALELMGKTYMLFIERKDLTTGGEKLPAPQIIEVIKTYEKSEDDE